MATCAGVAQRKTALEHWRYERGRLGLHAWQAQILDNSVDLVLTRVQRGGDSVVTIHHPILVAELDQLHGRQALEPIARAQDALPARAPVVAATVAQRQEIATALRGALHSRALDVLDGDGSEPLFANSRAVGLGMHIPEV